MKITTRMLVRISLAFCCVAVCFHCDVGFGTNRLLGSEPEELEHFEQHIRPLLISQCIKCHGAEQQKGGLRLDSLDGLLAGGESGAAIELGDADASLLVSAIHYDSFEMPPSGKLSDKEIAAVEHWINSGAAWPANEDLSLEAALPRTISEEDRSHWSFQPIADPPVPTMETSDDRAWCNNPIDRFVIRKLRDNQLQPAPEADRRTLIRRVFFDLLGVPPTPSEIQRFLDDKSELAYEHLIDTLLARPEYGERWARHWLDLVRYAESDGFRADTYRSGAWQYRDYVIRSLNEDKTYDRFMAEQLAGDELFPGDPSAWVGTAYFRLQPYEYNQRDVVTQRQDILNDITDVTADVFLGLGMKCARCHDHKFDPILQKDYFRLQAHFAALLPQDDVPLLNPDELADYQRQREAWEAATHEIHDQIAAIRQPYLDKQAAAAIAKFTPELQAMFAKPAERQDPMERQLAYFIARQTREEGKKKLSAKDGEKVEQLESQLRAYEHLKPKPPATTLVAHDVGSEAPYTFVSLKSDEPIEPNGIEVLRHLVPDPLATASSNSTGRRTALVEWLTSPNHPLTARVAVNRIWQHHFGRGLVETPSDFGNLGSQPTHPLLLDWLASKFMRDDWGMKSIHRLILCSATYKQSARNPSSAKQEQIDPKNRLYWRAKVRRLDAEQLVDASLLVSGQLEELVGGPSTNSNSKRRAIYRMVRRNTPDSLLSLFDGADSFNSTPRRMTTTTSPQALSLLNSDFGVTNARAMAAKLQREVADNEQQIHFAYELAFGRPPTEQEVELAMEFLQESGQLSDFCHVLLNANEFIYVD